MLQNVALGGEPDHTLVRDHVAGERYHTPACGQRWRNLERGGHVVHPDSAREQASHDAVRIATDGFRQVPSTERLRRCFGSG